MRDSARFHFGFTVPFVAHMGAAAAVAAVAASKGDLALVPATLAAGAPAWWPALEGEREPKIIARLPFVERADHPAGLPVFVVSRSAPDAIGTRPRAAASRGRTAATGVFDVRTTASRTASRRAGDRGLCAGQEQRARRSQSVQAVVERDAAGPEPQGARGLPCRWRHAGGIPRRLGFGAARGDRPRVRPRPGAHHLR